MKYTHLFLWSLVLASFSSGSEVADPMDNKSHEVKMTDNENLSFNRIPPDNIRRIARFMEPKDMANWRNVNGLTRFSLPLKKTVEHILNISGLENVNDNEPELAGVLRLSWISHDPFLFFAALMEEVACEKRPYKVIVRPLILHLVRTFCSFNPQEQIKYLNYTRIERRKYSIVTSVQARNSLAAICVKNGHFDLLFELFKDEKFEIVHQFLASSENGDFFFEFLSNNSEYVDQFLNALIMHENENCSNSVVVWIAGCIIKNLPQSYYENKMRTVNPVLSGWIINILILSTNVPESEYSRIHAQVVKIFEIYSGELVNNPNYATFLRILNDIRFGFFDLVDFQAVDIDLIYAEYRIRPIAKAALLANKTDLFLTICAKIEQKDRELNVRQILYFENLNVYDFQAKNFKIIIEMIQAESDLFKDEFLIFSFVLKFYAIKNLKLQGDLVTFEFVASKNLLEFGFPPELRIQKIKSCTDCFIVRLLWHMKFFNEAAINTFIPDLIEYFNIRSYTGNTFADYFIKSFTFIPDLIDYYNSRSNTEIVLFTSYEFIEFISASPNILMFMLKNGIRLKIASNIETLGKYLNLNNFELTCQIIQWTDLHQWNLTKLKTQDHLEKMEKIQNKTVAESFLQWESFFIENRTSILFRLGLEEEEVKVKYLEWRSVFAYWIKGSDKERIKEIKTPEFIELLKLDFPKETSEFLQSEQP